MTYSSPFDIELEKLTDNQLEEKISDLQKKYFMSQNPSLKQQIANFLDFYKSHLQERRRAAQKKLEEKQNGLDNLINVN